MVLCYFPLFVSFFNIYFSAVNCYLIQHLCLLVTVPPDFSLCSNRHEKLTIKIDRTTENVSIPEVISEALGTKLHGTCWKDEIVFL